MLETILQQLVYAFPEIFLLMMASLILVIDLFLPDRLRFITYALAQFTLLGCALLTIFVLAGSGGMVAHTFHELFVADTMAHVLKLVLYIAVSACLVYSRGYLADRDLFRGEYFVLVLFATLGMMVMISANHCISLYIGLELMSLCLYALVAMNRDSAVSSEAAMKYFILGALASGLLLYGMSMLYGATGTLEFPLMSQRMIMARMSESPVLIFGLVFVVAGLAFKIGAVPFHMWIPDVYHGAPGAMTLFIGTAPKLAAFAMAMRLLVDGMLPLWKDWQQMLIVLSVLSLTLGNLAAIAQTNIKRMFAYSTISHMGFMLLGLLSGVIDGNPITAADAYSASMFYVIIYVLMSLGGFGMILLLSRAGFEAENLADFKGLNQRSPWYAFIMLLLMFSMAGVPPTVGFYAKLMVLEPLIVADKTWLAVYAVMFSLVGAYYYLRVVKLMYFDEPEDHTPLKAGMDMHLLLSANGLLMLVLGIMPGTLMQLSTVSIETLEILMRLGR